ncbi:MAG TPA: DUF1810 domain-containing protein [Chthoniobacterales bacterium]
MNATPPDPFDLMRFVDAQRSAFPVALSELKAGEKRSHWMWFIFPQMEGLGFSAMARKYAIRSRAEAVAYLEHPVLGTRLRECVDALLRVEDRSAREIMGEPDDLKLLSSITLFAEVAPGERRFSQLLEKYFQGRRDQRTLDLLQRKD